jgi:hypothetical protein
MVRRIESNGLIISVVKLNGILELHFMSDAATFTAQYVLHGTDINDTDDMEHVRETAAGQPVVMVTRDSISRGAAHTDCDGCDPGMPGL